MGAFLHSLRKGWIAICVAVVPLAAQTGLGVVTGRVQDATKAAITNAKVELTNTATGVARSAMVNQAGLYNFDSVPIGPYHLTVQAAGFQQWETNFKVPAGQTVTIDVPLVVGNVQTKVEVEAAASTITLQTADVSDVKDALRIHDLPLNGRQITNLFDLTPGVEGGGNPRVNGMKVGSAEMTLDGISQVDRFGGGMARVQPGLDTVQEFRIETANSSAQFSRPATVEMVTRSGTNEIHGAAFETFRNNAAGLRARQRQDLAGDAAKLIRNEYGVWAGGPVIKNKTFWFVDWEGMKQRQNKFARTAVPTAAMWNGNLSNITDANGDNIRLYDPLSTGANGVRVPFNNNIIPSGRISQYAKIFQSVTPTPNIAGNLNPWTDQNFSTYYPITNDQSTLTLKGDHNFSSSDMLSGAFTRSPSAVKQYGGKYGFPPPGCTNCGGSGRSDYGVYSEYVRETHIFSPSLLNQVMVSSHRSAAGYGTLGDSTNWANKLGLPNPFGVTGWPTVYTDAYNLLYYGGWDGDNLHNQNLTAFEINDDATWVKGKHTVKFGFQGRQEYNNVRELQQAEGSHSFYANWTSLYDPSADAAAPYTGSGYAELLMGLPSYLSNQYNRGYFYFQQKDIGLYVNDSWKVSPRLTVNVGLRWEHWTPYHEKYDRLVNVDPNNYVGKFQVISPNNTSINQIAGIPPAVLASWQKTGLSWVTANQVPGFPSALVPNYWRDFGPRLGIAYRLSDKFVIRGGYGMYYWPMPLSQILQASRTNPPLNLRFQASPPDRNGTSPNYALLNSPGAGDFLPNATVDINNVQSIGTTSHSMFVFDPHNWADDRMQQWTFTLERQVMRNSFVRLSYIGTHGSNLEQRLAWNSPMAAWNYQTLTGLQALPGGKGADARRPNPNWNGTVESHVGYSNSNSVQVEFERQFTSGLTLQASYTYDHALTTSDAGGFSDGGDGALVPLNSTILGNPNLSLSQRLGLVYYNSGAVPPQSIKWNGVYELPFGRGKKFASRVSRAVDALVGGWQVAFIGNWRSGLWMGVNNSGEYLWGNPALDPGQQLTMNIFGKTQQLYFRGDFDPTKATSVNQAQLLNLVPADRSQRVLHPIGSAFNNRLPFTLANGQVIQTSLTDLQSWNAQNFYLGPRSWNEDTSVFKYFTITEKIRFRLSGDFFNTFNHPNNVNPNKTTGLVDLSQQANQPRIIQLGARLEW